MDEKRFIFIAGCPRSGTTALARMMNVSKDIVLGIERYGHLANPNNFILEKKHFDKNRFFDLQKGDTFYDDFEKYNKLDIEKYSNYDHCKYFGDKRPILYECYDKLFKAFDEAIVYFLYRDVYEVASSYVGRAELGVDWPSDKRVQHAVRDWNRSLWLTLLSINNGYHIKCIAYDQVFSTESDVSLLFRYLGLDYTAHMDKKVNKFKEVNRLLRDRRESNLTEEEVEYIAKNAKFQFIDKLQKDNQLALLSGENKKCGF